MGDVTTFTPKGERDAPPGHVSRWSEGGLNWVHHAQGQAMLDYKSKVLIPALGLAMLAGPAFADAIDGNWCHDDGRRFIIRGAEIVTPGGKRMEGNYSRHAFSYMVPAPEPGAGQTIFMTLLNENTVQLRHGEASGSTPQETWVRCGPSVSALEMLPPS